MIDKPVPRSSSFTADIQIPFKFVIIHGADPEKKSPQQKAFTKSINLTGLVFEYPKMEIDGFHLSFTESTYGRNSIEIIMDLGKRFGNIEVIGQVDWYERRPTHLGYVFVVGIGFVDIQADALSLLRDFLQQNRVSGLNMEENYFGFNTGKIVVSMLKSLLSKGLLDEAEVLDLLWEAKDPTFPWSKKEIKELLKL